jgi:hypothetical protein
VNAIAKPRRRRHHPMSPHKKIARLITSRKANVAMVVGEHLIDCPRDTIIEQGKMTRLPTVTIETVEEAVGILAEVRERIEAAVKGILAHLEKAKVVETIVKVEVVERIVGKGRLTETNETCTERKVVGATAEIVEAKVVEVITEAEMEEGMTEGAEVVEVMELVVMTEESAHVMIVKETTMNMRAIAVKAKIGLIAMNLTLLIAKEIGRAVVEVTE